MVTSCRPTGQSSNRAKKHRLSQHVGSRLVWLLEGRCHHNLLRVVAELAESRAGNEVIMSIAGHVSGAMLSRYSHVRMEAKRRALDEIAARQCAADEKRKKEAEQRQVAAEAQSAVVQ